MSEQILPNELIVKIMSLSTDPKSFMGVCMSCREIYKEKDSLVFCLFRFAKSTPNDKQVEDFVKVFYENGSVALENLNLLSRYLKIRSDNRNKLA